MIQLKVFRIKGDPDSAIFIDLYDTEPIKLTLSIEDITTADASSVFSKTFRVPASRNNNQFFKNAFEIDGIDYDVTIKKPAEILVDGAEFKSGHVRLNRIYNNGDQDKIDYELLFLGETRDFSSVIADRTLCTIEMTDFAWEGLPVNYTNATDFVGPFGFNDIVQSWNAWDGTNGTLTSGFADGDLLFPLIDHGNTYDDGDPEQGTIALGATGQGIRSFTHQANSLSLTRLKPMIRGKRVWDQIFQDAGYTYSSDFLNSDIFHQMYISAFGNNEQIGMAIGQTTGNIFTSGNPTFGNDVEDYMYNMQVTGNISGNYNIGSTNTGSYFVVPAPATTDSYYIMSASAEVDASAENSDYSNSPVASAVQIVVVNNIGGTIQNVLATGNYTFNNNTSSVTWDSRNGGYQPVAGDIIQVWINASGSVIDYSQANNTTWNCTASPGDYYAPLDLDCEYKQIDYIKDVLTMFRLVMQPDSNRPNNFIIEPWQEFIGSGTTYDWSDKLVQNKDVQLEPLFNTQSQEIEFTFQEDDDLINKFHQDNNKHAYGWLRFNSNNELLKGKRDVEVTGIAPTPIDQIASAAAGVHPAPDFILPIIIEVTGENFERLPIKPKSRFLFYNGQQDITVPQDEWYLNADDGSATLQDQYPLVSPYSDWPVQGSSLNLNFSNDTRYYVNPYPGAGYFEQGSTLYDAYWSRYINSLYNKFSRRLTANFILNNVDLQDFSFNDVIFINGKYFRPEKIIDVQVGATTEVKVQLITLKDQRPIWLDEPLTGFSVVTSNQNCTGQAGNIQITTNGTPNFTWSLLESGETGTYSATVGQAPYIFEIPAAVGTDTLLVVDSLGREAQIQVDVPASTSTPITTSFTSIDPTVCSDDEGQCNGSIQVTVNGAIQPAVTYWIGEPGETGNTRINLCEGTYQYYVVDAEGCESDVVVVELECNDGLLYYNVEECGGGEVIVVSYTATLEEDDVVSLNEIGGCYLVLGDSQSTTAIATVDTEYQDCQTCEADQPNYVSWKVESCTTVADFQYVPNNTGATLSPGLVIEITNAGSANGCYTVIEESEQNATYLVTNVFQNCATCEAPPAEFIYFVEACDGSFGTYATSTLGAITLGSIMQFTVSGTCVSVGQLVTGQIPTDVLDDSQFYIDCNACNGIVATDVCTYITGTDQGQSNGTYVNLGMTYDWVVKSGQTIVLCAEENSVVGLQGTYDIIYSTDKCGVDACPPPQNLYAIQDCVTGEIDYAEATFQFSIGDVVQYTIGGTGATYCGTITFIGFQPVTPAWVLNSPASYSCGDVLHCNQ
jgi:hypothetical protein